MLNALHLVAGATLPRCNHRDQPYSQPLRRSLFILYPLTSSITIMPNDNDDLYNEDLYGGELQLLGAMYMDPTYDRSG